MGGSGKQYRNSTIYSTYRGKTLFFAATFSYFFFGNLEKARTPPPGDLLRGSGCLCVFFISTFLGLGDFWIHRGKIFDTLGPTFLGVCFSENPFTGDSRFI